MQLYANHSHRDDIAIESEVRQVNVDQNLQQEQQTP